MTLVAGLAGKVDVGSVADGGGTARRRQAAVAATLAVRIVGHGRGHSHERHCTNIEAPQQERGELRLASVRDTTRQAWELKQEKDEPPRIEPTHEHEVHA